MGHVISRVVSLSVFFLMIENTFGEDLENDIVSGLQRLMCQRRNETTVTVSTEGVVSASPETVLAFLRAYEDDPSREIRDLAYALGWRLAMSQPSPEVRREVSGRLVRACSDPDPLVWQRAGRHLLTFVAEDFTDATKAAIHELLLKDKPKAEAVRVCGVANMQEEIDRLEALLIDEMEEGRWRGTVGWAARLARARMGSRSDISRCIEVVEAESDSVLRVAFLLREIAYIRQPAAIDVLRRYLESDERLPSPKVGGLGTSYSQHAMDLLAETISNFPVKKRYVGEYTQAEIEVCREWMRTQEEFTIIR